MGWPKGVPLSRAHRRKLSKAHETRPPHPPLARQRMRVAHEPAAAAIPVTQLTRVVAASPVVVVIRRKRRAS